MPSAFTTGRTAAAFDPVRLEFSAKTGIWSVVHVQPNPSGGYSRDVTELQVGHNAVVGVHAVFHGYTVFAPSFDQRLRPWAPDQAPLEPPREWASPSEAIKLPLLVDKYGPLWILVTSVIAMNAVMQMLEGWSVEPEYQQGQLPIVAISKGRPVKIKDRPGETFYAPVLTRQGWCPLEQAQLGKRVTPILAPAMRAPQLSAPPGQPTITAASAVVELPWEETPQPKPLPEVKTAATPPAASTTGTPDPFDIFRRQS
jgi:hypothetical protein